MNQLHKIEFMLPAGIVPEGTGEGDEFDVLCSFRVKQGGVCLIKMGDMPMPGYDAKDDKRPSYGEYGKAMQDAGKEQGYGST